MRTTFWLLSFILLSGTAFLGFFTSVYYYYLFILLVPLFVVGVFDIFQDKHAIRKNFPVIGNLRYFFEFIRPEIQQYFVESNLSGRPISREMRAVVYQRAKGVLQTQPFGTQRDVYEEGHVWMNHSMYPKKIQTKDMVVQVGSKFCTQPYTSSIFNISAMSYGSISSKAIHALNLGALEGGFYHNTGEGGISSHHLHGGDLVWQIGTGYFGCRTSDGDFDPIQFREKAHYTEVKMIELKLSQGAKPGKGGLLPGIKVTEEIAEIRGVPIGEDVESPAYHKAFDSNEGLLDLIQKMRELAGGKPVGIKLCVGRVNEFEALCQSMVQKQMWPDFITVDGAEGGTGAAPLEFANSMGTPLEEGLALVVNTLNGYGLTGEIKVVASGKVFTAFHALTKMALGADIINSGRGMMLAVGCIQALKCNSNHCPVGVATNQESLMKGLDVDSKSLRVANYHNETVKSLAHLVGAAGYDHPEYIHRIDIFRRMGDAVVASFEDIFPSVDYGSYLNVYEK